MGRIIFNEDPNHFIFTRARAGVERVTREDLVDFILQYKDTQITDFMICICASLAWYDSKRTQNAIDKYKEWLACGKTSDEERDPVVKCTKLLVDIYEKEGVEMHKLWVQTLRDIGIHPWISVRMNDIHETDREDSFLFSDFYKAHRAMNRASHRTPASYYEYGLDYLYEDVRRYYMTLIEEALDTFDMDGLELDWMREIYSIGIGREYEGTAVINAFMREVFARVKAAEQKWGHPIRIAVRLPDTPEKCLRLGFDFFDWVNAGLVDLITVTSRWSSIDNNMPIDLWKKILADKPVELAAGLEILIDAYNRRGRKYWNNTYETAIASACAYHSMGADAIYLFNYMDALEPSSDKDDSLYSDREIYHKFLCTAGSDEGSAAQPRRHVVTYDDVSAVSVPGARQLPLRLSGERGRPTPFSALRIVTGKIPAGRTVHAVLGFARGTVHIENVTVYLNAKKCRLAGPAKPVYPQYEDMEYFIFEAENDGALPPVSVLEVGISEGETAVHWAEIDIL